MSLMESAAIHFQNRLASLKGAERIALERNWQAYLDQGFPDSKAETWKYTNLHRLTQADWSLSDSELPLTVPKEVTDLRSQLGGLWDVLVVIDGLVDLKNSKIMQTEIRVSKTGAPPDLENVDGFWGFNLSLASGGFRVEVADGKIVQRPLAVIYFSSRMGAWLPGYHELRVGDGAQLRFAEICLSADEEFVASDFIHIRVGKGARLDWVRSQELGLSGNGFAQHRIELREDSVLEYTGLMAGAKISRSTLQVDIADVGAEAHVNGLVFGRSQQHLDQRVLMRHLKGQNQSTQLFKGVLKDRARSVLNGKIYIAHGAQKVASLQLNHNLLLSPGAEADTKPELEVYADDVKANHGASVGRMNESQLFYLMSRGIPRSEASQMLARAFVDDVLLKIGAKDLRHFLEQRLSSTLPNFSTEMELDA